MTVGRLIVVQGSDVGREYVVPKQGGSIGRDANIAVQLTDLAVSRTHCHLHWQDGALEVVDGGSRNLTHVNGRPIARHRLVEGDEIGIGTTRLVYLPAEGSVAVLSGAGGARVTMEVNPKAFLRATLDQGAADGPAQRYLVALNELGKELREATTEKQVGRAACEAGLCALGAERAVVLLKQTGRQLATCAASFKNGSSRDTQVGIPQDVLEQVFSQHLAVALEDDQRHAAIAPLLSTTSPVGVLYVERSQHALWQEIDLMALSSIAQLVSAALSGHRAREALQAENQTLQDQVGGRTLIGTSPALREVTAFIAKVGPTDATILLTGESGSGKELVARGIHNASHRAKAPFVAMNCAALSESLIESELFGHEKGAFTGATGRKTGRFEAANGGTLFLDEVGELPLACQAKFLRVLEEQVFERVGGTQSIAVSVRVVAATNRDLPNMVSQALFREDLYYRLSVIHTSLPSLRERVDDIELLAEHFLRQLSSQVARKVIGFSDEAIAALRAYAWPGNVRELRNAIERAIVLGEGQLIQAADLPAPLCSSTAVSTQSNYAEGTATKPRSLKEIERAGILEALAITAGNKAKAAQVLGIDRSTLYKKIRDYELE